MEQDLRAQFIEMLEEKYGEWNKTTSRFGTTSFGAISKDLSIGASQFSKLIYGTATAGMYQRSIANIKRLMLNDAIQKELSEVRQENLALQEQLKARSVTHRRHWRSTILLAVVSLIIGGLSVYFYRQSQAQDTPAPVERGHPLSEYFDQEFNAKFNSPYLDISEVQDYCPCSAYEGAWSLDKMYKLPLPGSKRPGVYYLGKSADVRMKCSRYESTIEGKANVLYAYEYLINEIWVDTEMTPLSPKYFNKAEKTFTDEFEALTFENNPQFKKVAVIHSFFTDKFEIYPDSIIRDGEPCGRFATDVDTELAAQYEIDIKYILENVIGDLTTTNCSASVNPFSNPNDLTGRESVISFSCLYTIENENLGIGGGYPYVKGYRLEKQNYADNLICD